MIVCRLHRTEFKEGELLPVLAHPLLSEEHRTFRRCLDREGDNHKHRGTEAQQEQAADNVYTPFDEQYGALVVAGIQQVGIKRWIAWAASAIAVPFVGEKMKRDIDMTLTF